MLFNSTPFILGFLPLCLTGCFLAGRWGGPAAVLCWLVAASLFFYGWWNPPFVLLLATSIGANYAIGQRILHAAMADRLTVSRRWLIAGLTLDLGLLSWFKYANFLLHIAAPTASPLHVFLPLAISFFTFQQVMFLVDSYRRQRNDTALLPYAAFIAFFPHLIAGPIVRPREIIPQLSNPAMARLNRENLAHGLTIFLLGLGKKLVLADTFGAFANTGFNAAAHDVTLTFFEAWYATLAYALQIYFDFSGYSDMAIGLARALNLRFPLNFNSPYQADTITEFWRRWHITLSQFLRDYLYIPLGGNRHGEARRTLNLMITMLLGGLWHGAGWQFVLWGGLHGCFLAAHAQYRRRFPPWPRPLAQALTLLLVIVAWVPFRADDLTTTVSVLRGMAGINGVALPVMVVQAIPGLARIVTPVPVLPSLGDARTLSFPEVTACLLLGWFIVLRLPHVHTLSPRARDWALTAGFAFTVQALFFAPNVAPFLYFQF